MSGKEAVYDEQVFPLMQKILEFCDKNKIAMLASFSLDNGVMCTSCLLSDECDTPQVLKDATNVIYKPGSELKITLSHDGS